MRIASALLSAAILAGQPQPPVFRGRTELVRIDVVVVDEYGRPVQDLNAADFRIRDRGRPRPVVAFEQVSHSRAAGAIDLPFTPDIADNSTGVPRLVVLLLDDLHFQARTAAVREMAEHVVLDLGPGATIALVTTSGEFGVEPTANRAAILAELDRFVDRFDPEGRRLARGATMPVPAPLVNAIGTPVPTRGPADPGRFFGDMSAYATVEKTIERIGAAPGGRKTLVWISGGLRGPSVAQCKAGEGNPHHCSGLLGLLSKVEKSNVTAYGIHTGDFPPSVLKEVADRSGGFVVPTGDADYVTFLIDALDHYYVLGFDADTDGKKDATHSIAVDVLRPGLTVQHRTSYHARAKPPAPRNRNPLARLSEDVLPVSDLPLKMSATRVLSGSGDPRTVITLETRVPRPLLEDPDGSLRDVVRYEVWAVDLDKKKAGRSVSREARFVLTADEATELPGDPVPFQMRTVMSLKPGRYQLRASAFSTKTGKGGSVYLDSEIEVRLPRPETGSIVLHRETGGSPLVRGGAGMDLLPAGITLDRTFTAADILRVVCDAVSRTGEPADVTTAVFDQNGRMLKSLDTQRTAGDEPTRVDARLTLQDFAPGTYRVSVVVRAGSRQAHAETTFVVR